MKLILLFFLILLSACANFTPDDQPIIEIEKCIPKNQQKIPKACAKKFSNYVFTGVFNEMRSKFIGSFVGNVTLEIKTGEKSVMCKTEVTDKNIAFLRALKKGDQVKATGNPTVLTRFKRSHHSYILLENCLFAF